MNAHERAMVNFAVRWSPFGGGEQYIFAEFGVSVPIFYRRVLKLVESRATTYLDSAVNESLRAYCQGKLSHYETSGGAVDIRQRAGEVAPPQEL
ncbi:hypothetical protein OPAG_06607 [Rhodococcus opacus PD630]|uniref:hypothetical protein n=1 Tax=Rhodococcus opacus TaxID=37919 RepID=UPI00029CCD59|nr:hypothetical protein [Rhodococcus opacus]EHI43330.1 hypothetical protein OPAG_06607 [Rhodococcus opacus PD630]UDH01480.1 hypothetical protein K2Z90_008011 [Rhodococcus opacus PD630]